MAKNIEIKASLPDFEHTKERAASVTDLPPQRIKQLDTFFLTATDRLKLREFEDGSGQLISYTRSDRPEPSASEYEMCSIPDPMALKNVLARALGIRGVVKKVRYLFIVGNTRIHLDRVEALGDFLELEVVLAEDQSDVDGQRVATDVMNLLGVNDDQLIDCAYIDLITAL